MIYSQIQLIDTTAIFIIDIKSKKFIMCEIKKQILKESEFIWKKNQKSFYSGLALQKAKKN